MTGYYCPVEGCAKHADELDDDQPPFASRQAVRGHVNAMSDDDHRQTRDEGDWQEALEAPEAADDDEDDDQPDEGDEADVDQPEGALEAPDEGEEAPETDQTMPTDDEYKEQHSTESSDDDGKTEGREADDEGGSGFSLPALSTRSMMMIVGVLAVVVLLFVVLNRDTSESTNVEAPRGGDDGDDEAVSNEEVSLLE